MPPILWLDRESGAVARDRTGGRRTDVWNAPGRPGTRGKSPVLRCLGCPAAGPRV